MSVNELPSRAKNQSRKCEDSRSLIMSHLSPHQAKTPLSKYGASVLISATATRINGRIAITPSTADAAPCSLTSGGMSTKNSSKVKPTYAIGRRLPMNMVVSQVACRRSSSPVRELQERLVSEPPSLDPLLDHLLNYKTPGSKTGTLPHPDDLMGSRSRRYRRMEGPEDDIHKAFISVYGDAEASLSVRKKLRLNKSNENEDPLIDDDFAEEPNRLHSHEYPASSLSSHDKAKACSPIYIPPSVQESKSRYHELYGSSVQSPHVAVAMRNIAGPSQPSVESWVSHEASPPPRRFTTSSSFLKTVSEVSSKRMEKENYNFIPQQESIWKKYLNNEEEKEDVNPWVVESLGNSNQQHHINNYGNKVNLDNMEYNYQFKTDPYLLPSKYDFNFLPCCSPTKPDLSPTLAHTNREVVDDTITSNRQSGKTGMPESAECRWLYESSPSYNTHRTNEKQRDEEDEELANLLFVEKESIFSTSTGSGEKDDYYNLSSEE